MPIALSIFVKYGYLILFLWVLIEQLGVPVPSTPAIITAGTLTSTHRMSMALVLIAVLCGSLTSDSLWYWLGKRYGGAVVKLLCRISMESHTCVRRTERYFKKHGGGWLVMAKFVPGLGSVAAPIAGQTGMKYRHFVVYDTAGILLWGFSCALAGRIFGDELKLYPNAFDWVARSSAGLFVLLLLGFLIWRSFRQRTFLREIRMARLNPSELKSMIDQKQPVFIVDLRHPLDYLPDPRTLPGAVMITPDDLVERTAEIPRDRDVVLFCTCPGEATSAKTALAMRKMGVSRVRPLLGGFDEWKRLGYPLEAIPTPPTAEQVSAG